MGSDWGGTERDSCNEDKDGYKFSDTLVSSVAKMCDLCVCVCKMCYTLCEIACIIGCALQGEDTGQWLIEPGAVYECMHICVCE